MSKTTLKLTIDGITVALPALTCGRCGATEANSPRRLEYVEADARPAPRWPVETPAGWICNASVPPAGWSRPTLPDGEQDYCAICTADSSAALATLPAKDDKVVRALPALAGASSRVAS